MNTLKGNGTNQHATRAKDTVQDETNKKNILYIKKAKTTYPGNNRNEIPVCRP